MKITNAWIHDPTLDGVLKSPTLCVEVTSLPDETIPYESFAGDWEVGKFGPFVQYRNPKFVTAGDFNVRFRGRFPVVVDIALILPVKYDDDLGGVEYLEYDEYSLPLSRARQLVRKFDPAWRLLISERAAEAGSIEWTPVQTNAGCRHWGQVGTICNIKPARTIRVQDVDLPLCEDHIKIHNQRFAASRKTTRAS